MVKTKEWLDNVVRINNVKSTRHNKVRLDMSERICKFENTFFDKFIRTLTQEDFIVYPETKPLIDKLCEHHSINEENLFLTPGSDVAIKTFFEMSVNPRDEVILSTPCFPMYNVYSALFDAKVIKISYKHNLTFDMDSMINSINKKTSLVILANPNNPVGDYVKINKIEQLVRQANKYDVPVLIDEAYGEFSRRTAIELSKIYDNVGVSRTFSKAMGGGGIRIGYVVGSKELVSKLNKWRLMYEVAQPSIKFAQYILNNYNVVTDYVNKTIKSRNALVNMFADIGIDVISSECNWLHIHSKNQTRIEDILKKHNILFKSKTKIPYDSREWIRLTVGPDMVEKPYISEICESYGAK